MQKLKNFIIFVPWILMFIGCNTAERNIRQAEQSLSRGEYEAAANYFKKAYQRTSPKERKQRGLLAYRMAEAYNSYGNIARAVGGYKNALRYGMTDTLTNLRLGQLLAQQGQYKAAAVAYQEFLDSFPEHQLALLGLLWAKQAPEFKQIGSAYTVKQEKLFASSRSDYAPMLLGDESTELYFSTTRNSCKGEEISDITGMKPGDIFVSKKNERGQWQNPEPVEGEVNTAIDEGACCFTSEGTKMYFTVCPTDPNYPRFAEIWVSSRSDASWGKPSKLQISADTLSSYAHPTLSVDGEWLYFVSDMPGGVGGMDLWRLRFDGDEVELIENLGPSINTEADEMFPTMRPTGELYFSSNGRGGMGGLDLYAATEDTTTHTWNVQHLPAPMNSSGNDFGITFEGFRNRGFFSSSRSTGGRGWDKIYSFSHPEVSQTVKGWVYEADGYQLPEAEVFIVGDDGTQRTVGVRDDGSFEMKVEPGARYVFLATCNGYLNLYNNLSADTVALEHQYVLQFPMASLFVPVLIRNVFFEFDSAELTPESTAALERLATMLNDNPGITIELSAHTDSRGSNSYNKRLSQRRAESVVKYLVSQGIAQERLTPIGYGEDLPKVVNRKLTEEHTFLKEGDVLTDEFIDALQPEQQDICHALNRRTQFRVLRTDYK